MRNLPHLLRYDELAARDEAMGEIIRFLAQRVSADQLYLVGGYIRDFLLGNLTRDADFVYTGDPGALALETAQGMGGSSFTLHGDEDIHRVTLKRGEDYFTLDFSRVKGDSLEEDLSMRDFTINAMALDIWRFFHKGEAQLPRDLVDKHYGWRDLNEGILRECHNETFLQDPVRILRGFRFKHLLGLEMEERTLNHMKKYANMVTRSPGERIALELLLTLSYPGTSTIFDDLANAGLLQYPVPSLFPIMGLEQNTYHHLDVWKHTLLTLDELDKLIEFPESVYPGYTDRLMERLKGMLQNHFSRSAFLRLAALLHDVGKAQTFSRDETGRIHFHGHQVYSEEEARKLSQRLRLSRRSEEYLARVVGMHMHIASVLAGGVTRRAMIRLVHRLGEYTPDVVLLSTADRMATRGEAATQESLEKYVEFCCQVLEEHYKVAETPPLLRGRDLIEELGMEEGRAIGELLGRLRLAQLEGRIIDREQALELARSILRDGQGGKAVD